MPSALFSKKEAQVRFNALLPLPTPSRNVRFLHPYLTDSQVKYSKKKQVLFIFINFAPFSIPHKQYEYSLPIERLDCKIP